MRTVLPFAASSWHLLNSTHEGTSLFCLWLGPETVHPFILKPTGTYARNPVTLPLHPQSFRAGAREQSTPLLTTAHARGQSACPLPDPTPQGSTCLLHPWSLATPSHTPKPCTQRQPGRGTACPGADPAEGGPGQQPSAAGGPAQRSSKPTARILARSGWIQQRGDSLSEKPGAREGTGGSEERVGVHFLHIKMTSGQVVSY